MADKAEIIVICGPTATGKTSVSVALAKMLSGEVISADSMQIYQGLRIGTAQPTKEEMQGVAHHLVDFLAPETVFSVADFVKLAAEKIEEITARGHVPIIAGGTGLYISSLVDGIRFTEDKSDPAVRERLQQRLQAEGIEPLYEALAAIDPDYAQKVHPNNHGRVLRALEIYEQTGETMTERLAKSKAKEKPYRALLIGLNTPERAQLYERIDRRVDLMLEQGILEEARTVYEHRDSYRTAAQAIGYKEFFPYFEGTAALPECAQALKQASRNYAKRQLTWFRRMEGITWLEAGDESVPVQIAAMRQSAEQQK